MKQNLGIILVLLGALCLLVYFFIANSFNWLLASSLVLEVIGIVIHIILNKR